MVLDRGWGQEGLRTSRAKARRQGTETLRVVDSHGGASFLRPPPESAQRGWGPRPAQERREHLPWAIHKAGRGLSRRSAVVL